MGNSNDQPTETLGKRVHSPGRHRALGCGAEYARDFANAIVDIQGGNHVVTFDWTQSVTVRPKPDAPSNDIADCLMLAAYKRNDVPPGFVQNVDGAEFAIRIPVEVLNASTKRLIDIDESLLFKLALR